MEELESERKRLKTATSPGDIKNCILSTEEPLIIKNNLSWSVLNWSLDDWVEHLGNQKLDVRIGTKQCTKVPQWEANCNVVSVSLRELLENTNDESTGTWMYFDYKHLKQCFGQKAELLESLSWADFGFDDKNGRHSTIWIGTQGAYTPCHMDSYGCNVVAQVYGRKLWVLFPPSNLTKLKPTRVPYEESSTYSNIHFTCGTNVPLDLGEARVVELCPGDVLLVPRRWWHYVENLTTSISVNMWIPLDSDHKSRLEEALTRFFVASTLKTFDTKEGTSVLNPNEMDLLDETVDLRQISWCAEQVLSRQGSREPAVVTSYPGNVSAVPSMSAGDLKQLLLDKCGCDKRPSGSDDLALRQRPRPLSVDDLITAFCHPEVIAKVADLLLSSRIE